jgi:glycine cleavage system H protein
MKEARVEIPGNLKYTATHEWIADHGDGTASVGITALATEQLGELVYVELPQPGAKFGKGDACAVVESTKAASDVYTPLSGEVVAVNEGLSASPNEVNSSPYGSGWLFKLKLADKGELAGLLDAQAYRASSGEKS